MHSERFLRQGRFDLLPARQAGLELLDGFLQTRGGLAGRGGQSNAQRLAPRLLQQKRKQHSHRVGFAGAGTSGNDAQPLLHGDGSRDLLRVGFTGTRRRREASPQASAEKLPVHCFGFLSCALLNGLGEARFVFPVAPEIESAPRIQNQRLEFPRPADDWRLAQFEQPLVQRRQPRAMAVIRDFWREQAPGHGWQIETDVPLSSTSADQGCGQRQLWIGSAAPTLHQPGKMPIDIRERLVVGQECARLDRHLLVLG